MSLAAEDNKIQTQDKKGGILNGAAKYIIAHFTNRKKDRIIML